MKRYARWCGARGAAVAFLAIPLLCALDTVEIRAQTRDGRDAVLDRMSGAWAGTCDVDGKVSVCERTGAWVLGDAYLRCETRIFRDRSAGTVVAEYVEYLRVSGENVFSAYLFGNDGVSRWGTVRTGDAGWEVSMDRSDGLSESGVWAFPDPSTLSFMGTVNGTEGDPVKVVRYTLQRR